MIVNEIQADLESIFVNSGTSDNVPTFSMFRISLICTFLGLIATGLVHAGERFAPYAKEENNYFYHRLFCEDRALLLSRHEKILLPRQAELFQKPDPQALKKFADDPGEQSCMRLVVYNWLRKNALPVASHQVLGVVVEMGQENGLATLGAYADSRVIYMYGSGTLAVFEDAKPDMKARARTLLVSARPVIDRIAPWTKPRLAPPATGNYRMTVLASDGLYFIEGSQDVIYKQPMAAAILPAAVDLLNLVVVPEKK